MIATVVRDRHLLGDRRAAAAVEFAITGMVLLTFFMGIIEIAIFVADQQDLSNAVFRAGRYAIVHGSASTAPASTATIAAQVTGNLRLLAAGAVTATAQFSPNNNPGSMVVITGTYSWSPVVPLVSMPTITISATSAPTIIH